MYNIRVSKYVSCLLLPDRRGYVVLRALLLQPLSSSCVNIIYIGHDSYPDNGKLLDIVLLVVLILALAILGRWTVRILTECP